MPHHSLHIFPNIPVFCVASDSYPRPRLMSNTEVLGFHLSRDITFAGVDMVDGCKRASGHPIVPYMISKQCLCFQSFLTSLTSDNQGL